VQYPNFDVIVVDNGSSDDPSPRLKREFPSIKLLASNENLGFTGGNNLAIEDALRHGAAYVLLLNNDTLVDPPFLTELVQVGESDCGIGILGPKIFYATEPQRIWYAGGKVKYGRGSCDHVGKGEFDQDGKFSRTVDTGFITGCAMMIKSAVLGEIGLLDSKLFFSWEDNDFCMRARNAGYRCVFVPMAHVWHKISQTCGLESPFTLYLSTRNQLTWIAKHVPFPYKPVTLAYALFRKLVRMILLVFKSPDAAAAVWAGIWAFFFRIYGPPPKGARMPAVSGAARA
jgi:GT2 family glycosyltransferase